MRDEWWPWVLRALWVSLPFTAGQLFGDALAGTSRPVQLTATVGAWVVWAVALVAMSIPHHLTLTPVRILVPGSVAVAVWATVADGASSWGVAALATTATAAVVALAAPVGAWFVNGSSYGDERRVPLRPPGMLLLGPVPLAWAVVVTVMVAGPLLLAAKQWVAGTAVLVLGGALAVVAARALHQLARRWLVFVPAGVVLHDHLVLGDPALFRRTAIAGLGPALADTTAADLSAGGLGLALELRLRAPAELGHRRRPGEAPTTTQLEALLLSVSRPGVVLAEARRRRIAVG